MKFIDSNLQGSRRCRAKVITDIVNGETAIVNIKGTHNHEVNIKRNKNHTRLVGSRATRDPEMFRMSKAQASSQYPYGNMVFVEEDDESINV